MRDRKPGIPSPQLSAGPLATEAEVSPGPPDRNTYQEQRDQEAVDEFFSDTNPRQSERENPYAFDDGNDSDSGLGLFDGYFGGDSAGEMKSFGDRLDTNWGLD